MNTIIHSSTALALLVGFAVAMISIVYVLDRRRKGAQTIKNFLVARRNIGWFMGGTSIAASWIWAPALFISVQMAYQSGIAGIFWFAVPNMVALALFAIFAPRIRAKMPEGYTLPQYIRHRLGSERVHKMYLFPYFFYQLMAVTVQLFAGGNLVSLLTGIPLTYVMPILAAIAMTYTLISGLEASIITDFVQMLIIIVIGAIILPMTWNAAGGLQAITAGIQGIQGIKSILDPHIAFSFGIVTSIGLIAGAISDQQYWQRSFAVKKTELVPAFIFGAILFGIVPIALSTLGFLGANPALGIALPDGVDVSMIGVQTVAQLLPGWAVSLFVLMLLAGLSSTLDSGLMAASSLWVTDVVSSQSNVRSIKSARMAVIGITLIGLAVAYLVIAIPGFGLRELWWVFNTIAACVMVPTVLSLYWNNLDERGVFWGVFTSFVLGIPLFIYANILGDPVWIVGVTLSIVALSTGFCVALRKQ